MAGEPPQVRLEGEAGRQRDEDLLADVVRNFIWRRQRRETTPDPTQVFVSEDPLLSAGDDVVEEVERQLAAFRLHRRLSLKLFQLNNAS